LVRHPLGVEGDVGSDVHYGASAIGLITGAGTVTLGVPGCDMVELLFEGQGRFGWLEDGVRRGYHGAEGVTGTLGQGAYGR